MAKLNSKGLPCMPNRDVDARLWLVNFASSIAGDTDVRETVGISDEQCAEMTALAKAFDEAYMTATSPMSNTAPNVQVKTLARNAAVVAANHISSGLCLRCHTNWTYHTSR